MIEDDEHPPDGADSSGTDDDAGALAVPGNRQVGADRPASGRDLPTSARCSQSQIHAGEPTSDRDQAAADRDRAAAGRDQLASDRDRSQAAADQRSSSRDQAAADRDHAAADRDQMSSDRDQSQVEAYQRTSDRDLAAADREHAAADREQAATDRAAATHDREQAESQLRHAQFDQLTGAYGRELGMVVLEREINRARRGNGRLVLAYVDVDWLKSVNDGQGHAAGDTLLRGVVGAIQSHLRSYDSIARIGGDEFVCAMADAEPDDARRRFEQIRATLAQTQPEASISVGFAALLADDTLKNLTDRGDRALYEAKRIRPARPN